MFTCSVNAQKTESLTLLEPQREPVQSHFSLCGEQPSRCEHLPKPI